MKRLIVRPEAEADIRSAREWYDRERDRLGIEFEVDLLRTLDRIAEMPRAFPAVSRRARRAVLDVFPYLVVFVDLPDEVRVIGVIHAHRNPTLIARRISADQAHRRAEPKRP